MRRRKSKIFDIYITTGAGNTVGGGSDVWVNNWLKLIPKHLDIKPILLIDNYRFQGFEEEYSLGDAITVSHFAEGEFVDVSGVSKGKGFQGVVKRHGFAGVGQATHGQHNRLRAPGSIGAASYPARVFKGMRMAGRMGGDKVKVQNLKVLKVVTEKNLLVVKGAIPGHKNAFVTIQK